MKKIMIFAAVAALLSLSSCGKEEIKNAADASSNGSPVFTAGINPGTKTTVDAQYGTLAWENSDVITITDGAKQSAEYKITKIDVDGYATFEFNEGDVLGAGPYTAVYGTQPEKNQTYSATAPGKLYMTASSENNVLTFNVQCALMEINLTKEGESVKKIEVTGTPTGESKTTYTLTCTEAVSIAETKAFYISLPAGTYTKIVITDSEGKVCTLNVKNQGIPVTVNQIVPATFAAEQLNFPPDGALPGVFSVSDTKKVFFSQGNLQATYNSSASTYTWGFAANQYDYIGNFAGNTTIDSQADGKIVDLFGWSTDATNNNWGIHTIKDKSVQDITTGNFNDWGKAYCASNSISPDNTWRTLSKDEWEYLLNNRKMTYGKIRYSNPSYLNGVVIGGVRYSKCLFLYPDNYNGYEINNYNYQEITWDEINAAGIVFLPAAGARSGNAVNSMTQAGYYWSSTEKSGNDVYNMGFTSTTPYTNDVEPWHGYSVRLITDVK